MIFFVRKSCFVIEIELQNIHEYIIIIMGLHLDGRSDALGVVKVLFVYKCVLGRLT